MKYQIFSDNEWIYPDTSITEENKAELYSARGADVCFQVLTDCFLNEEQVIPEALSRMGPETRKFWNQYVEHLRQFRLWKLSQLQ